MKKFPAIRLHGDKDKAATYIRRARTELQRTKDLRARMGVPVYEREVELGDGIVIHVLLSKQEEIINITAPPPEPPPKSEEELQEEYEFFNCPPGFIVYKNQFAEGEDRPERNGYLLSYEKGEWKQTRKNEEERKYSGNCAWWHLAKHKDTYKKENQKYIRDCELVSWVGDTTPHHYPPDLFFPDYREEEGYRSIYGRNVYFQGRKIPIITSPFSRSFVCGAALLHDEEDGEDYIYALVGSPDDESLAPRVDALYVLRRKWVPESNYDSGSIPSLQQVGNAIRLGDIGLAVPGCIDDEVIVYLFVSHGAGKGTKLMPRQRLLTNAVMPTLRRIPL